MKTELCNLAKQDPVKTSSQVYSDWLANQVGDIEEEEVLPSLSSCRSMMNRARREEMPPLPASIAEIDLGPLSNTLRGDPFILHHDDRMFVLSTRENLRALQDSSILFMDGTFKAAPRPLFSQLFCIHAVYHGHFVTLAYCLLIDKSRQTYYQLFEVLKRKAENDLVMNPEQIMSDFESELMPAIRHSFTNTQHRGCYFHHSQAVWRQVQRLGLQVVYREDHRVQTFVRKLLAFLPVFAVRPAVTALQDELQDEPAFLEVPQLQQLLHYYINTWLNGDFPLSMWNVTYANVRTNNHVEGWHSKLNRLIGRSHPNMHTLVFVLRREQAQTEQTMIRARLGDAPPLRRKKYRQLEERLRRVRERYRAGHLNSNDFLAALSHMIHQY
ncbi:hypothetical protein ACOMHN_061442 [Nucella lapillus]